MMITNREGFSLVFRQMKGSASYPHLQAIELSSWTANLSFQSKRQTRMQADFLKVRTEIAKLLFNCQPAKGSRELVTEQWRQIHHFHLTRLYLALISWPIMSELCKQSDSLVTNP